MKEDFISGVRRSLIFRRCLGSHWRTHSIFDFDVQEPLAYARGAATATISWEVSLSERAAAPSKRGELDVQRRGFCDSLLYVPDCRD